jgi:hypothetical protein
VAERRGAAATAAKAEDPGTNGAAPPSWPGKQELGKHEDYAGLTLAERLCAAVRVIGPIAHDDQMETGYGDNKKIDYTFRSIEAIAARAQAVFAVVGLVLSPRKLVRLEWENVTSRSNNPGRHWVGQWRWKLWCDGPNGREEEILETAGECIEYGDKGINKAQTQSRKNALVAALNLAERAWDPDSYTPEERVREQPQQGRRQERQQRQEENGGGSAPQLITADQWSEILKLREQLNEQSRQALREFAGQSGIDLQKPMEIPAGGARRLKAKAEQLLRGQGSQEPRDVGLSGVSETPYTEGPEEPPPSIQELRDRMVEIQERDRADAGDPMDDPANDRDPVTGVDVPTANETDRPVEDVKMLPEPPPKSEWTYLRCWVCSKDAKAYVGMPCIDPSCNGTMTDEEPF